MGLKVLVVDDSGVMRKIIIRSLNAVGVTEVVEAGDGVEALERFQQHKFNIVLTDWNMPVKSGLELTKDIRALGSTVPIMMITTEAERSRVVEAIQAGVNDYLAKPFEADTLRAKLDKYCNALQRLACVRFNMRPERVHFTKSLVASWRFIR